ncbi:D-sedoheptulose 7-phosphate isomerase [soil metagenome]
MGIERVILDDIETAPQRSSPVTDHALLKLRERQSSHQTACDRLDECWPALLRAAELVTGSLKRGRKVLIIGNGGSAAEAQHFAAELVGRFRLERRAYPVMALTTDSSILTAIGNDYGFSDVFSRQVEAFAQPGDLLIAFSTSGESENAIHAALEARRRGASVLAVTGERACRIEQYADVVVHAPSSDTPAVQELHTMFTHMLCDIVESELAGLDERRPA